MNFKTDNITDLKPGSSGELKVSPEEKVFCRHCLAGIADKKDIIEIEGSALHYKRNPAGIYFTIICFSKAWGINIIGEYTHEFTWFEGFKWSIVVCSGCSSHLGWHYSGNGSFFGFISRRITGF